MKTKRLQVMIITFLLLFSLLPATAFADTDPAVEYAFIPNSGEASVSKVDLVSMTEVARYYTEPRVSEAADKAWRTSRIAQDSEGNAYVLNVGADAPGLQGSVARIQADTSGLTTHAYPDAPLAFGTDEAVEVMNVGLPGEMPRAIAIDDAGYIWIGFYSGGYLQKYVYNDSGPSLDAVGDQYRWDTDLKFYEMKFAPDGTLWISSRSSTPTVNGTHGIFSFDGAIITREGTFNPYALLIGELGEVYATAYDNTIKTYVSPGVWNSVPISGSSQNRGMAFDNGGNIWIASTTGHNSGLVVYSYDPGTATDRSITYTLTGGGTTPVGMGRDAEGNMWAVCRSDALDEGFIEGFNPGTLAQVGAIQVGYRPYAYSGFIMPEEPELYRLCGFKYDETGVGLEGWEIQLENLRTQETWTTTTDEDGKYCFEGLPEGEYEVSEAVMPGWEQIFPGGDGTHTVTLPDENAIYGISRESTKKIYEIDPITGFSTEVFVPIQNTFNISGPNGLAYDSAKDILYYVTYPTHEGVPAKLYKLESGVETHIGNLDHEIACAAFYDEKYYYIDSNLSSGTDDMYEVVFTADGSGIQIVNPLGSISGDVYAWKFYGDVAIDKDGTLYGSGRNFIGPTSGNDQFFKVQLDGTGFTMINDDLDLPIQLAFGGDGVLYGHNLGLAAYYAVDTTNGTIGDPVSYSDIQEGFNDMASGIKYYNFVNKETYDICGYKLDYDTGEGIEGWTINLLDSTGAEVASTTTDADGKYCFYDLPAGTYTVIEEMEEGWVAVDPDSGEHEVVLPYEGEALSYDFINKGLYDICGHKYRTGTDMPLGGWLITLEKHVRETEWDEVSSVVTDIYGAYCFEDLPAGDYRVSETEKDGWTKTAPVEDYHFVTLPDDVEEPDTFFDFYNDPDMECYDETIWAYGGEDGAYTDGEADLVMPNNEVVGNPSNNWGWTNLIDAEGTYVFTLYRGAGQNDLEKGTPVGTLTVMYFTGLADVTYTVAAPYELSEAHLWIGDTPLPVIEKIKKGVVVEEVPTSAPGQLSKLGYSPEISPDGLTATIEGVQILAPFWVAAHGVVDWCEMVASEETTYYHWGEGYPYGASPEVFASASVTPMGMDVWWLQGIQWYHDIYSITEISGWTNYAVEDLNEPVKMLHEMHFPGLEHTWYQRIPVDASVVPVPNPMSILIH